MKKCFAWYAHFNMASKSVAVAGAVVFEAAWHGIVYVDAILHCSIPTFFPVRAVVSLVHFLFLNG